MPDTAQHKDNRFFLSGQRKDEVKHPLSLVSESLAESHPVCPCGLKSRITYIYNKISHLHYYLRVANLRQFLQNSIRLVNTVHIPDENPELVVILLQLEKLRILTKLFQYSGESIASVIL